MLYFAPNFGQQDLPIASAETVAPIRFLPEYDNILIAHQNRSRILLAQYRKQVFLSAGRVIGTVLIDGFVRATWKVETEKESTTVKVALLEKQPRGTLQAIENEGRALARFVADGDTDHRVEIDS